MNKIILLSAMCCMGFTAIHAQTNLVTNPDMEDWTGATLNGGSQGKTAAYPAGYAGSGTHGQDSLGFYRSTDAHSGNYAFNVKYKGTGAYWFATPPTSSLIVGNYIAKVWIKGKGLLRFISLTNTTFDDNSDGKELGKPSGTFANGNYGGNPFGGTTATSVKDLADWAVYSIDTLRIKPGYTGNYRVCFSVNNTKELDGKPFLFDDISLVYAPLTQIRVRDAVADTNNLISEFQKDVFNYTIPISYTYDRIPELNVVSTNTDLLSYTQPSAWDGDSITGSAFIGNSDVSATYTVTFKRSEDYIDGCLIGKSGTAYKCAGIGSVNNLYPDAANHGDYLGHRSFRNNATVSDDGDYYITPSLSKGAGTLSLYVRSNPAASDPLYGDSISYLKVYAIAGTDTTLKLTVPSTELTSSWVQKSVDINLAAGAKVKIWLDRTDIKRSNNTALRNFLFDDIRITPYSVPTGIDKVASATVRIYAGDKAVVLEPDGISVFSIYSITGALLQSGVVSGKETVPVTVPGIYLVKLNEVVKKVVVK